MTIDSGGARAGVSDTEFHTRLDRVLQDFQGVAIVAVCPFDGSTQCSVSACDYDAGTFVDMARALLMHAAARAGNDDDPRLAQLIDSALTLLMPTDSAQ